MRVVKLSDEDNGCPCGGTHVKHLHDIAEIEVTKIIKKGKNTRVSYTVKDLSKWLFDFLNFLILKFDKYFWKEI